MRLLFVGSVALLGYVVVGYPAVMAALARLRPRPLATSPGYTPRVSLIIAAYNESEVIAEKLRNSLELSYPADRYELIVVTDGSDDDTAERALAVPGVRVLHAPERGGKLAAIARGAEAATGEILIFSDANNAYVPGALRALVTPFADPAVGVVTGRKAIDDGQGRPLDQAEGLYWRYESFIRRCESATGSTVGAVGEIVAFRRQAFMVPPPGTMNEDFTQAMMAAAAGWRVVYAVEAVSLERASATTSAEAGRRRRLFTGRLQAVVHLFPILWRRDRGLAWRMISHKGLRPVIPAALLCATVSGASLARRRGWGGRLCAAAAAFLAMAALGSRAERRGRRSRLLFYPFFIVRMNVAAVAGVADYLRGRREAVWAKTPRG